MRRAGARPRGTSEGSWRPPHVSRRPPHGARLERDAAPRQAREHVWLLGGQAREGRGVDEEDDRQPQQRGGSLQWGSREAPRDGVELRHRHQGPHLHHGADGQHLVLDQGEARKSERERAALRAALHLRGVRGRQLGGARPGGGAPAERLPEGPGRSEEGARQHAVAGEAEVCGGARPDPPPRRDAEGKPQERHGGGPRL
mmetsp:Transcript_81157/g.255975  ORF Transcript_81157/g.255975 Transcript_81157/m.255975 type:complete len:200 (-) Transcript_81157:24-623(-)